jgi:hypothetical protein
MRKGIPCNTPFATATGSPTPTSSAPDTQPAAIAALLVNKPTSSVIPDVTAKPAGVKYNGSEKASDGVAPAFKVMACASAGRIVASAYGAVAASCSVRARDIITTLSYTLALSDLV